MTDENDNRYIKRYDKGPYEIRIGRDVAKFFAQVYQQGSREDTLTATTLKELESKIDRYLAGEASAGELRAVKDELVKARQEVAALTKSLMEVGDGNAKAAQYEKELEDQDTKLKNYERQIAQLESDVQQYKDDLEAAKSVKKESAKGQK